MNNHCDRYPLQMAAAEGADGGGGKQDDAFSAKAARGSVEIPGRPAAKNPFAVQRLSSAPMIAGLAAVLGGLVMMVLAYALSLGPANAAHRTAMINTNAIQLTQHVDTVIDALRLNLERVARLPEVEAALRTGNAETLRQLENRLRVLIPDGLRLRITPTGGAQVALQDSPPLTFAGLELIRQAESGEASPVEAASVAGQILVNLAAPVRNQTGDAVIGSVFATVDAQGLVDSAAGLDTSVGSLSVQQRINNNPPLVLGSFGVADGDPALARTTGLRNPSWETVFVPAPRLSRATPATPLGLLAAVLAGLLVALGGLYFGYGRFFKAFSHDLDKLLESLTSFIARRPLVSAKDYLLDTMAGAGAVLNTLAAEYTGPERRREKTEVPKYDIKRPDPAEAARSRNLPQVEEDEDEDEDDEDFLAIGDMGSLEDEEGLESLDDDTVPDAVRPEPPPAEIFRAYDIRGIVDETLTAKGAYLIGRAIGSEAAEAGEKSVAVGRDGRHSSPTLADQIMRGIASTGRKVIDVGAVPTPLLYFATHVTEARSGVMVTGSHNPPDYNGFKIVIAGETLAGERIMDLRERIEAGRFVSGPGEVVKQDVVRDYIDRIVGDVAIGQPLKVVADCGNGIAGRVLPDLLEALGCEVIPLYCEVDGDFPNHHPDPADPANLSDLRTVVEAEGADVGLAFDGDGDRIGVVTDQGKIIWPDTLLMLFSQDIVSRNPGADVIFDVKCSRHLNSLISDHGGRPIMWKTGHSHMKAKLKETGALLAGEFSGHICFGERWFGFDDGLYSAVRLLEILGADERTATDLFADFPEAVSTPEIKVHTTEDAKFGIVEQLARSSSFTDGDVTTIDGLRVDYPDGWGLVRASNTSPVLTLRFEADDAAALGAIEQRFRDALTAIDPSLNFQA